MICNLSNQHGGMDTVPGGVYGSVDYHGQPPWDVAMAAGYRYYTPAEVPEGYVVTSRRYEQAAEADWATEIVETERIPTEQERIAALLPIYGAHVARLRGLLVQIGLDIPTTREEATARVLALVDGGNAQAGVLGLMIERQYEMLDSVKADVGAIWDAIRVQVGP